jgi:hypothetical protein
MSDIDRFIDQPTKPYDNTPGADDIIVRRHGDRQWDEKTFLEKGADYMRAIWWFIKDSVFDDGMTGAYVRGIVSRRR